MKTTVFTQTEGAWNTMLQDIRAAKEQIYFHQFIVDSERTPIGSEFLTALREAHNRGVKISTIIDAAGSWHLYQQEIIRKDAFLSFYVRRHKLPLRIWQTFYRDHRKLLVVDETYTHIGGVVLQEETRDWNDMHLRIEDKNIAQEAIRRFKRTYKRFFENSKFHLPRRQKKFFIEQSGMVFGKFYYRELRKRIKSSKTNITIVTPYLSPPHSIQRYLEDAANRGVQVNILIPKKCDSRFGHLVNLYYAKKFIEKGINVFLSTKMNHAKVHHIDDWLSLGSVNLDRLSLRLNYEMNYVVPPNDQKKVIKHIDQWFKKAEKCNKEEISLNIIQRVIIHFAKWIT